MAKFYVGLAGNNFAILDLTASHPIEALEELRRGAEDGWARFQFADSPDWGYLKVDAVVLIKFYRGAGRVVAARMPWRERGSAGG